MGSDELEAEQRYVTALYARLDELRRRTAEQLDRVRRTSPSGTPANRSERDAFDALHTERLASLRSVEERLCFGRLDLVGGRRYHLGRIGLSDDDQRQLLVDWRAPAAEPFYQATAASPRGVVRRRHLTTRGRSVTAVADDVFDLDALGAREAGTLSDDSALMAALTASRTGRMRDIVATVQAEQDRIIRAPLPGVLVVQGGPGTGKTAVALHRAAYLLYTHRERIARSGVLLVGPNPAFLRYIEQVLPSLGETGVLLATPGQLMPGVEATADEDGEVAALKGDVRMADVLTAAVRRRQRVPECPVRVDVDGNVLVLRPHVVAAARTRARRSRKPHNVARVVFVREVLNALASRLAAAYRTEVTEDNRADLLAELRESRDVRREVNLCWMPLTPTGLLARLYADPAELAACAPQLGESERRRLARPRGSGWTVADVPLLDEAAELLGEDDSDARSAAAAAAAERRSEVEYAQAVLEMTGSGGAVTADQLIERYAGSASRATVAERAARDRSWAFGHVVVDEAQELSPLAWRMLLRRCPSRSMTVVGDVAQTGALAGARSWEEVLDVHVPGRWRVAELTVNYRTPREVMDVAGDVLAAAGVEVRTPTSARDAAVPPSAQRIGRDDLDAVAAAVRADPALLGEGSLAVVTSRRLAGRVGEHLTRVLGADVLPVSFGAENPAADEAPVRVLPVASVKGLEFDSVVLLEPAEILAESARGIADLYVALTRPTQRLLVLHSGDLPAGMERLQTG